MTTHTWPGGYHTGEPVIYRNYIKASVAELFPSTAPPGTVPVQFYAASPRYVPHWALRRPTDEELRDWSRRITGYDQPLRNLRGKEPR